MVDEYRGQSSTGEHPRLYHNNHDGTFTNVAPTSGLNWTIIGMSGNFTRRTPGCGESEKMALACRTSAGEAGRPRAGKVSAGSHHLKLRSGDGQTHSASVKVRSGGTTSYCWDFHSNGVCQ